MLDHFRRRIQESKRKATLQGTTAKQNLDHLLGHHIQLPICQLKNALTVLPAIPSMHSHALSTTHSEQHRDGNYCQTGFSLSQLEQMHHSLLIPRQRLRMKKCKRISTLDCTASRSLNPTLKLKWQFVKNHRTATNRSVSRKQSMPSQTPPTVIILDPENTVYPAFLKQSTVRVTKRPSLLDRRIYTVPAELSPLQKYSISAWDAPDEVSLLS